ncbi:unnamed protein product, partial [Prunus brigantina]
LKKQQLFFFLPSLHSFFLSQEKRRTLGVQLQGVSPPAPRDL